VPRRPLVSAPVSGPLAVTARAESAQATPRSRLEVQVARLSADRTLLAVMVTALALIASGFVIFQLFQGLHGARMLDGGAAATRNFGVTLVCLGELLLLLGSVQHLWLLRELQQTLRATGLASAGIPHTSSPGATRPAPSLTLISAALLLSIGAAALLSMLAGVGPFH